MDIKGVAGSLAVLEHWFGAWILSFFFNFLARWSTSGKGCLDFNKENQ
jgi:SP family facilitated glucose transporter-like MFS transporter 8